MDFASEINIYALQEETEFSCKRLNEINFGSSGSFTPNELSSYWRTIHAANILKNWAEVTTLVNSYCSFYVTLIEVIFNSQK